MARYLFNRILSSDEIARALSETMKSRNIYKSNIGEEPSQNRSCTSMLKKPKYFATPFSLSRLNARLPTAEGEFRIYVFKDSRNKEHLALVMGEIQEKKDYLVRIHSECLTGDVFGSLRCDCGEQLRQSIQMISEEGSGIIIYLRQEGRGIGLTKKLQAYNLQDNGYDTVEANIVLGHKPDERDFTLVASILIELGVKSIRLISNNPEKFTPIIDAGIKVKSRIPVAPRLTPENLFYLRTKASKLNHTIDFDGLSSTSPERETILRYITRKISYSINRNRPFITLSYAQSIDGYIAADKNKRLALSDEESLIMTHQIRSKHNAILVGIGTILADDPQLTVRNIRGKNPQPIILDTNLKFPLNAKLLNGSISPWIFTGETSDIEKQKNLEKLGAKVFRLPLEKNVIELGSLMSKLAIMKINSVMVEGGAEVIKSFINKRLIDLVISTVTPFLIGRGVHLFENISKTNGFLTFQDLKYVKVGKDLIVCGIPSWKSF